ncbi:hypothetical protein C8N26_0871 [Tenacibaculum lutimaris]|uniref:Lipoprotein n=1 Tax=Tenacibaculum lutimaris TaxID=285258 RepID=A0A420E2A5_9FLAO|nr:hypothetical protein [Tenacibaculum lutimaris]RKF04208.1 hypothetical protein C8N26_0871 [Tenacibaculum lutimaris]
MKKTNLLQLMFVALLMSFIASCDNANQKCDCDDWQSQVPEGTFCYVDKGRPSNMLKYNEIVNMLESYDKTRKEVLEKSLGFEDTRVNSYPIQQLKDYLGYIENLCAQKEIPLTGINIISTAYPENYSGSKTAGYQTLIFMPTTTIDGEEFVTFDPLKSKKGVPVTFKSILAKRGYNWSYDNSRISKEEQKAGVLNFNPIQEDSEDSSGANRLKPTPPY